jgi:hypothetical protein
MRAVSRTAVVENRQLIVERTKQASGPAPIPQWTHRFTVSIQVTVGYAARNVDVVPRPGALYSFNIVRPGCGAYKCVGRIIFTISGKAWIDRFRCQ